MGVRFKVKGNWQKTRRFLTKNRKGTIKSILEKYGDLGVGMLSEATPKDTGLTANSWYYEIVNDGHKSGLYFCNSNINDGVPIAIILQYGHSTGSGGWVQGVDYINPALKPIFDSISESIWKEVDSD